jgi:ferritin-like metal-binding protein YciE
MRPKNYLEKWLRDAYAMEKSAIEMLEKQIKHLKDYPSALNRLNEHLEETRWQADEVAGCLAIIDSKPSGVKDAVAKFTGNLSVMMNASAQDDVLKCFISNAAFENMEAACYRSLAIAAEEYGYPQIKNSCLKILRQEDDMAAWCQEHIELATVEFLSRHDAVVV